MDAPCSICEGPSKSCGHSGTDRANAHVTRLIAECTERLLQNNEELDVRIVQRAVFKAGADYGWGLAQEGYGRHAVSVKAGEQALKHAFPDTPKPRVIDLVNIQVRVDKGELQHRFSAHSPWQPLSMIPVKHLKEINELLANPFEKGV